MTCGLQSEAWSTHAACRGGSQERSRMACQAKAGTARRRWQLSSLLFRLEVQPNGSCADVAWILRWLDL